MLFFTFINRFCLLSKLNFFLKWTLYDSQFESLSQVIKKGCDFYYPFINLMESFVTDF